MTGHHQNICLIAKGLGVPPAQLLMFDAVPDQEPHDDATD
jgi:hypothetical protein